MVSPLAMRPRDIAAGEHVHTHNIKTNLKGLEQYTYTACIESGKGDEADRTG